MYNTPRNMFWIFVRLASSNKYPWHVSWSKQGKKSFLSFIILVHVRILYSCKFFLKAESWGTNAVVITRFLCITLGYRAEVLPEIDACFKQKYEKYQIFSLSENFHILGVRFSEYFNMRVFIMKGAGTLPWPLLWFVLICTLV